MTRRSPRIALLVAAAAIATAAAMSAFAQAPAPAATPAAAPATTSAATPAPTPPGARLVSGIRNKLSAGDLRSAESLAEVWRETQGDDGNYLLALSWLARGSILLREYDQAEHYAAETRKRCDARMARGVRPDADDSLEIALGAAIEVEAQVRERTKGKADAVRFLDAELARTDAPVALRSRIGKRRNLIDLVGRPAPEIVVEDHAGGTPPTLASLRGKPVLIYVWDKGCGDCRAQSATLSRVAAKYADRAVVVYPLTRYYVKTELPREKARLDSTWAADYAKIGPTPLAISTASMERYGGSSTPTFVFVDRKGIVRGYLPYRLTEAGFDAEIAKILR
jgi:cytochrome c biogenesis protein CcmG/thiol:disulfide interchange protein DsbE